MILPDRVDQAAVIAAAGQAAVGTITTPEWSTIMLGIRPVLTPTVLTTAETNPWTWQLNCNELKGMLPVDFPGQPTGNATATASGIPGIRHPYFPLNVQPLKGGEKVNFFVTKEVAHTGLAQAYATFWFGEPGDEMPSSYDPMPGVQRYGQMGAYTACGAAGARSAAAQWTITGGDAITELYGYIASTVWVAGDARDGLFQLESTGFEASPIFYGSPGSAAPALGTGQFYGHVEMCKEPVYMPIDRYTVIRSFFEGNPTSLATDYWQAGVQFIRPGEG